MVYITVSERADSCKGWRAGGARSTADRKWWCLTGMTLNRAHFCLEVPGNREE